MGLHEIDEFSKIRSIYLSRKMTPPKLFAGGRTHTQTHRLTDTYLVEIQG